MIIPDHQWVKSCRLEKLDFCHDPRSLGADAYIHDPKLPAAPILAGGSQNRSIEVRETGTLGGKLHPPPFTPEGLLPPSSFHPPLIDYGDDEDENQSVYSSSDLDLIV